MDELYISLKGSEESAKADAKVNSESENDGEDILLDYFDKAHHTVDTLEDSDEDFEQTPSSSSLGEINLTDKEHGNANKTSGNHLKSTANGYRGINRSFDSSSESSFETYDIHSAETKDPKVAQNRSIEDNVLKWSAETSKEKGKFDLNLQGNTELTDKGSSKVTTDDDKKRDENFSLDQETIFELPKDKMEETDLLFCQYCLQDEKKTEAITYCMDCGLYMCSSCWRFHRKFLATRGHSVAFQQELIATEFDQYQPLIDENSDKSTTTTVPAPMLDKKLVDSGKYSRSLTPTDNALCGPCQYENIDEPATRYCQDCGDYMCRECFLFHQKLEQSYNQHHVLHQSNCEDFDTFVPAVDEDIAKEKETKSLTDQFGKLYKQPDSDKHEASHFKSLLLPCGTFNVKLTCDPWECSVVGIDCFPDGRVVLIDNSNNNVKLFSSWYQPLDNLDLPGQPADVAIVTDQKVVVSIPNESRLAFIRISGASLSLFKTMKTISKYARIAGRCEEIYALCDSEGEGCVWVHVLNKHGEVVTFIQLDLSQSAIQFSSLVPSLAVSPAGGTIYLSDKNHCVYAFGLDGRIIFKHKNLEIFDITSLAADTRGVYVCCKALDSIYRISYDGTDSDKVISKTQGILAPQSVAVKGKFLLVGLHDSYVVKIYSI